MVTSIIFDLDSCLAAADEPGQQLYASAFAAIRAANHGDVSEDKLEAAFNECWRVPFDAVADKYGFTEPMRAAGWHEFRRTEVTTPMHGYGDLAVLKELSVQKFLVTSGFRRLQESKVHALNFADWFTGIYVDAIDEPDRRGKKAIFEEIMAGYRLASTEVLVVGDSAESEIAVGNELGMQTVQILRPGVSRTDHAWRHIHGLADLKELL